LSEVSQSCGGNCDCLPARRKSPRGNDVGQRRTDQLVFENVRLGFQVGGKGQSAGFVGTVHMARQSAREPG
jgi:hypothetical protein